MSEQKDQWRWVQLNVEGRVEHICKANSSNNNIDYTISHILYILFCMYKRILMRKQNSFQVTYLIYCCFILSINDSTLMSPRRLLTLPKWKIVKNIWCVNLSTLKVIWRNFIDTVFLSEWMYLMAAYYWENDAFDSILHTQFICADSGR